MEVFSTLWMARCGKVIPVMVAFPIWKWEVNRIYIYINILYISDNIYTYIYIYIPVIKYIYMYIITDLCWMLGHSTTMPVKWGIIWPWGIIFWQLLDDRWVVTVHFALQAAESTQLVAEVGNGKCHWFPWTKSWVFCRRSAHWTWIIFECKVQTAGRYIGYLSIKHDGDIKHQKTWGVHTLQSSKCQYHKTPSGEHAPPKPGGGVPLAKQMCMIYIYLCLVCG